MLLGTRTGVLVRCRKVLRDGLLWAPTVPCLWVQFPTTEFNMVRVGTIAFSRIYEQQCRLTLIIFPPSHLLIIRAGLQSKKQSRQASRAHLRLELSMVRSCPQADGRLYVAPAPSRETLLYVFTVRMMHLFLCTMAKDFKDNRLEFLGLAALMIAANHTMCSKPCIKQNRTE